MRTQVHTLAGKNGADPLVFGGGDILAASDQLPFEFYAPPPDPAGHVWRAFSLDTPEEEAAAAFLRRYGRMPEFVFESRGLLLCGPIPEVLL